MKPSDLVWEPIIDLVTNSRLPDWDKEAVILGVDAALDKYLAFDTSSPWVVKHTERAGDDPFSYRIDIELANTATGKTKVVDWKTRKSGKLDDRWEMRETRSPQKRLYAGALATLYGTEIFPVLYEVRGVMLDGTEKPQQRTLKDVITEEQANIAVRHLREKADLRSRLIQISEVPWIQDDSGCRLFGEAYKCEFEDACWPPYTRKPVATDMEAITRPLSHSSAKEFLRCPERYRALKSLNRTDEDDEGDSASYAGKVFHACMEMAYQQARINA